MAGQEESESIAPQKAIRRFDVFAEYSRQERLDKGDEPDVAKGYGIWIAKVVASRRFGKKADGDGPPPSGRDQRHDSPREQRFRSVGDELQTDETFDHDIIERMGADFYDEVFVPAIEQARAAGESYEDIRDSIRKEWKPRKAKAR